MGRSVAVGVGGACGGGDGGEGRRGSGDGHDGGGAWWERNLNWDRKRLPMNRTERNIIHMFINIYS